MTSPEPQADENGEAAATGEDEKKDAISSVIEKSPETSRIILFSSNEFLTDQTLQISATGGTSRYLNSLQLIQNALDWSLEDRGLLSIRGRGHFSRTLYPLDHSQQLWWEYGNYFAALILLLLVFGAYRWMHHIKINHHRELVQSL